MEQVVSRPHTPRAFFNCLYSIGSADQLGLFEAGAAFRVHCPEDADHASYATSLDRAVQGMAERCDTGPVEAVELLGDRRPWNGLLSLPSVCALPLDLRAFIEGQTFYDPAMKVVGIAPDIETKKRSQFGIKYRDLGLLYDKIELVDLP